LRIAAVDPRQAKLARAYVEGFNAADASRIGVAALTRQQHAEDAIHADRLFHVRGGYDQVSSYLLKSLRLAGGTLALGHVVRQIRWEAGRVSVAGSSGGLPFERTARRALITLPLGVLQARHVAFDPTPGEALRHADSLAMGAVVRVSLLFDSKPWKGCEDLGFLFAPGETIPTWWTPMPNPAPLLTGWVGGPKASALDRRLLESPDPQALEELCLAQLAAMLGSTASGLRPSLVGVYRHDWQSDPFSLGAYSYAPAGALDASARLSEPVENTLYFAGEHTDVDGHWGTVHAALKSGSRAAAQIIAHDV